MRACTPRVPESLSAAPASPPCRIVQTVASTSRAWAHSRPVSFNLSIAQSLDQGENQPCSRRHHRQAVLATRPSALIPLSVPNSPAAMPDYQPLRLDALIPLYVPQGRATRHRLT